MVVLAGDIGGTKSRLAIYKDLKSRTVLFQKEYSSQEHKSLEGMVALFLQESGSLVVDVACFGIAGPISERRASLTNLAWDADADKVEKVCAISRVSFINDLEANAQGIFELKEEEFSIINEGESRPNKNMVLISAGTGLGQAGIIWVPEINNYHVVATEGGHSTFSVESGLDVEIREFLVAKYGDHISWERVLSGMGILDLYDFFVEVKGYDPAPFIKSKNGSEISNFSAKKENRACEEAMRLFIEFYGREAGNLALKYFAKGGVYLGGGIAPKNLQLFTEENFFRKLCQKGRFAKMLKSIPVKVILNDRAALLGAARVAFQEIRH